MADTLATDKHPLALSHHNVGRLPDAPGRKFEHFQLQDAAAVTQVLAEQDVPLVLTGYHHVSAVLTHGVAMEVLAPTVCSYPQAMLVVNVEQDGTTVRLVTLAMRPEIAAPRFAAVTGKPLAQAIAALADRRISEFVRRS